MHGLAVWGSGPEGVFAVSDRGTVLHYDGQSWTCIRSGTNDAFVAVWGSSAQRAFFVGGIHGDEPGTDEPAQPGDTQPGEQSDEKSAN